MGRREAPYSGPESGLMTERGRMKKSWRPEPPMKPADDAAPARRAAGEEGGVQTGCDGLHAYHKQLVGADYDRMQGNTNRHASNNSA